MLQTGTVGTGVAVTGGAVTGGAGAACKFTDEDLEAISCESTWHRRATSAVSTTCQTHDIAVLDVGMISKESQETSCQTNELDNTNFTIDDNYSNDFILCFKKAADIMCAELSKNYSSAFDNYQVSWDDSLDSVSCLLTMNDESAAARVDMSVTSLAWNVTGCLIAAAFGHTDHDNWCAHKSRIALWNIDRHEKIAEKFDQVLDVDSCATCVAFHTSLPGLLVAGTFRGDVIVWDTSKDSDSSVTVSNSQQENHGDPICRVVWLEGGRSKNTILSISSAGHVTWWSLTQSGTQLKPIRTALIEASQGFRFKLKAEALCATVVALDHTLKDISILGTETGGIFICTHSSENVEVSLSLRPHNGPVYGIDISRQLRNVFMSCGTDGCVNIYSTRQESPLISLEPCQGYLHSCRWSPHASASLAVGGSRGKILFYNLQLSHVVPCHVVDCSDKPVAVRALEYNPSQKHLLASGDANGVLRVWMLGSDLTNVDEVSSLPPVLAEAMAADS